MLVDIVFTPACTRPIRRDTDEGGAVRRGKERGEKKKSEQYRLHGDNRNEQSFGAPRVEREKRTEFIF